MNRRIAGYDFARSLAVFGLVVVNFGGGITHADFHWLHTFIQSGATATFMLLAGVGVSLLTQPVRITNGTHGIADSRKRLIRRAALLLAVGICCSLIRLPSFLGFYSICIMIGVLLLTGSNRLLLLLAFMFALIAVVFMFLVHNYFDYYEFILKGWDALQDTNPWTVKGIAFRLYHYGFFTLLSRTAFLLIGIWLGRQNVHHPRVRRNMLLGGIVVAVVAECALWLLIFGHRWLPISFFYSTDILEVSVGNIFTLMFTLMSSLTLFAKGGVIFAIIGGSLMLTQKYPEAKWTRPFIATGQLALTFYVAHLVIGKGLLEILGNRTLLFEVGSAVIFCICAVIFSHLWRKRFDRGPLEWSMRRITG